MKKEALRLCNLLLGCKVNPKLLARAFTHSSYANEHGVVSNERLEFLGDSVVGLVVSKYLYTKFPDKDEGVYSKIKSRVVSGDFLGNIAYKLGLHKMLKTGEFSIAKNAVRLYANLFEALVGAVYLDRGFEKAEFFILRELAPFIDELINVDFWGDYKSELIELVQKRHEKLNYELVSRSGPDHEPQFVMSAVVDGVEMGRGRGTTKAKAQEQASYNAYKKYLELGEESQASSEEQLLNHPEKDNKLIKG